MRVRTCFISVVTIFIVLVVIFYFGEAQRTWAQAELGEKYGGYYVLSLSEYLGFEVVNLYPTNLSPNGEELAWIEGGERLIHTDLKLNKLDEEDISPYQGSYLTWSPQGDKVACLLSKGDRYNLGGVGIRLVRRIHQSILRGHCWHSSAVFLAVGWGEIEPRPR